MLAEPVREELRLGVLPDTLRAVLADERQELALVHAATVALGPGGATSFPKINGVTQASQTQFALDAGGGAMIIFRKRITLRFDFRNYTLFTPDSSENRQEYSGGLAVFF